jgi:hypothetical protein
VTYQYYNPDSNCCDEEIPADYSYDYSKRLYYYATTASTYDSTNGQYSEVVSTTYYNCTSAMYTYEIETTSNIDYCDNSQIPSGYTYDNAYGTFSQ